MIKKLLLNLLVLLIVTATGWAQKKPVVSDAAQHIIAVRDSLARREPNQSVYNAQSQKYQSGSVAALLAPSIKNTLSANFKDAMQGQIAGVQVIRANGMPASEFTIRVRGTSSIYAETEPLYLVDGVPVFAGPREIPSPTVGAGWGSVFSPLSDFNPNDIESIVILKDAASAAIYGARGANGVVLINTKKGIKNNISMVDLDYSQGVTNTINQVNTLNGPQYLKLLDQSWVNSGQTGQGPLPAIAGFTRAIADNTNTNQMDQILGAGSMRQMSLSASYGSDITTFYFSGSYRNENGILNGNNSTRYTGNMRVTNQISKKLSMGANVRLNFTDYFNMPVGYAPGGGFNAAQTNLPVYPLYNANGTYFFENDPNTISIPGSNVASFQDKNEFDNSEHTKRIYISTNLNYQLRPGLTFNTDAAIEQYFQIRNDYLSKKERNGSIGSGTGVQGFPTAYAGYEKYTNNVYNVRSNLSYLKTGKTYNLSAIAGFEFNYNSTPYFFAEGEGFSNSYARQPASAAYRNVTTPEAFTTNIAALSGYFANVNYAYKERYLAGATVRVDGSSRFGANNKYATFPAASLGWVLSNEDFFKQQKTFNYVKLRVSYGVTGNSGIGNYSSLEQWSVNGGSRYLLEPGLQYQSIGSPALKPEKENQLDAGIDFTLLKSRISGTIDVYNKVTHDLILQYNAPLSAGVSQTGLLLNAGSLRNRGVEFSVQSKNLTGRFTWNSELTIAHNSNQVLDLGGLQPTQIGTNKNIATYTGHALGVFYLAEYAGIDAATGREMIYDANHNKVIATSAAQLDAARVPQFDKPSAPVFFGGLNNTFKYKNWDLSALLNFSYGNYVLDEGERQLSYLRGNNNLRATALNTWTTAQPNTDFPKLIYNDPISNTNTTRFLHDASYLRAKNVTVGYTFKKLMKDVKFLKGARIYLSAQNLFTITKFPGWDPEVVGNYTSYADRSLNQGITYLDVPQIRTFAGGFSLKF